MSKAFDIFKGVVACAALVFGGLAVTQGLPASWEHWVLIGSTVSTALSQFTQKIGGGQPQAQAEKAPEQK